MLWSPSVECKPGETRKRIAIVGFSSTSRHLAPWHDPSFELWGMNQAYEHFQRRPDRWFELHTSENQPDPSVPTYLDDLRTLDCPVYMLEDDASVPTSVKYPLERVLKIGPKYFTSTAAYMVALAILEGVSEIACYGIDCTVGTEYEYQKPCLEWWLGVALGRGIKVTIPEASALLKAPYLYGYEPSRKWPRQFVMTEEFLDQTITNYKISFNDALEVQHRCEGAIAALTEYKKFAEASGRGSDFTGVQHGH